MMFTVTSQFNSVEVGASLVSFRLRIIAEYCRLSLFCLQEENDISDPV